MKTILYFFLISAILCGIMLIVEHFRTYKCKKCGHKMVSYYDVVEDCEVYICPNCGEKVYIRG